MATTAQDPRHQALVLSLRQRMAEARARGDAKAHQALFREAVYLGIQPSLLDVEDAPAAPDHTSGR
ncbi:hypothetical protein VB734_10355 [Synechococcus sp. BA-124 BA4]|jgi:hypothetical protein|uniref:hypothetical protein n=1 Tax=unclassified Synechococcus TaxID=2626047 RepID=UPI0018CD1151|nr:MULTISPECIES: hypothetical protein [unclassified Synechococcus]MEA5400438.1 hypothetical protein [Synechococcus sp. BA-124 BA4]QPN55313.1 hypothetical protein I1E95_08630 [Synechococcus sp. CBW1107]CAK6688702.1 hypothetical protein BBFGKLBO_00469 [Synechococcus sp. CBW1107]